MWENRLCAPLPADYTPPSRLPAKGKIEVVRYIRSDRQLGLFGRCITLAERDIHQYVTGIIKIRARKLVVVDSNGEIIYSSNFELSRELR